MRILIADDSSLASFVKKRLDTEHHRGGRLERWRAGLRYGG
jgi:hypothetical protein